MSWKWNKSGLFDNLGRGFTVENTMTREQLNDVLGCNNRLLACVDAYTAAKDAEIASLHEKLRIAYEENVRQYDWKTVLDSILCRIPEGEPEPYYKVADDFIYHLGQRLRTIYCGFISALPVEPEYEADAWYRVARTAIQLSEEAVSKDARISELEGDLVWQQIELQKMYGVDYQNERLRAGILVILDMVNKDLYFSTTADVATLCENLLNPSNAGKETNEG